MPRARFEMTNIASYQPAVDYRKTGGVGVITGRNFSWDAAGVRSDFASRLIAKDSPIAAFGDHVQSVQIGNGYHVIAANKVYRFVPSKAGSLIGTWELLATLTAVQTPLFDTIPVYRRGFTSMYLGGYAYVSHWNFGTYRVNVVTGAYTRLTSGTIPGFPPDTDPVIGMAETNGRAIYVTDTTVYWSGPNQPEDLVPTIGGAGFQVLGERIAGEPRTVLRVSTGVLIWTTAGALAGEFLLANTVFRWFQQNTDILPLNQQAVVTIPDGSHLALTHLGLFIVSTLDQPKQASPLFSEFLREFIRNKPLEAGTLWYSQQDNRLFMSLRQAGNQFIDTYCLDLSLDKWGIMSHVHMGMIMHSTGRSPIGYVDSNGIACYMLSAFADGRDVEIPTAPGTFKGLNSEVVIGYIRAENMLLGGDGVQELTDLNVYKSTVQSGLEDSFPDEGLWAGDPVAAEVDEGNDYEPILPTDVEEDEGRWPAYSVNDGYRVTFISDLYSVDQVTGVNYGESAAFLASEGRNADAWTGMVAGHYLSIRVSALSVGEFFRLNAIDATLAYYGQVI